MSAALDADRRARQLAQREFTRPLVLEAGAGTGKTATLVARVLAWCLGPGWLRAFESGDPGPAALARRRHDRAAVSGADDAAGGGTDAAMDGDAQTAARVLRGVVAITFTDAAAAEMAERVTTGLVTVCEGGAPIGFEPSAEPAEPERRRRAALLLEVIDQLQVRTIHAFCRKLLAEHPFEAGIHPRFRVDADGVGRREVAEETVAAAIATAYGDLDDGASAQAETSDTALTRSERTAFLTLAGRGVGPVELAAALEHLLAAGVSPGDLAADPLAPERRRALVDRLGITVGRLLTLLETRRVSGTRARNAAALVEALGRLRRRLRRARSQVPEVGVLREICAATMPPTLRKHLAIWARGETANRTEKERFAGAMPRLRNLAKGLVSTLRHVEALDPELLAAGHTALRPLLDTARHTLRRRGVLGFDELLDRSRAVLAGHPRLAAQIRRRLDQLLVDEVQDTDPNQYAIVRCLALEGPPGKRPGLFTVGDPKQSIYGWRNADLAAYEAFVAEVLAAGGERLPLVENFRSVPAVLAEVERLVAPVMQRREGLQPRFEALEPCERLRDEVGWEPGEESGDAPQAAIEHWVLWQAEPADDSVSTPTAGRARATSALEARALADDLLALRRRGVDWREIGILLRSMTDLEPILAALREAGVPYVVSRDRQYYRRREILDAAALVRTVLQPEDELALAASLRSVVVGVPDAALASLWHRGLPGAFAELGAVPTTTPLTDRADTGLRDPMAGEGAPALESACEIAKAAARELATNPPAVPGLERVRGWEHNLAAFAAVVDDLRRAAATLASDRWVERLRTLTLFEPCEASRYLGAFRAANLERFFDQLATALEEEGDAHRVLRRLRLAIHAGEEAEEPRPDPDADAVRVLSVHKAKGLEFPHVYLLQCHKEAGGRARSELETGRLDGVLESRLFGAASLGFDLLAARREEVARAELARTLYVALTRAAKRLVVGSRWPLPGDGKGAAEAPEHATTYGELLVHRQGARPDAEELAAAWRRGEPRLLLDGVLWRIPGREEIEIAEEGRPQDEARVVVTPARARASLDRDEINRREAARRMGRPFHAAVSKLEAVSKIGATSKHDAVAEHDAASDAELRAPHFSGKAGTGESSVHQSLPPGPSSQGRNEPEILGSGRRIATIAGTTLHRVLETWDLNASLEVELDRQRAGLGHLVAALADPDIAEVALERAKGLLERLARGELLRRFHALGDRVLARETPVLLPPALAASLAGRSDGEIPDNAAVGYVSGVVDLLYRDPVTEALVVADFKTDAVDADAAIAASAARYALQARAYAEALAEALALRELPRRELWYLVPDRVHVLDAPTL